MAVIMGTTVQELLDSGGYSDPLPGYGSCDVYGHHILPAYLDWTISLSSFFPFGGNQTTAKSGLQWTAVYVTLCLKRPFWIQPIAIERNTNIRRLQGLYSPLGECQRLGLQRCTACKYG